MWNNTVNIEPISSSAQELYLFVKVNSFSTPFMLIAIYAKPYPEYKKSALITFKNSYNGDFNDISSPVEKFRGNKPNLGRINLFKNNMDSCELLDLLGTI